MNLFYAICFVFLSVFLILSVYAQSPTFEKHEFVYKKILNHEIKANIFIPNDRENCPVVVYVHGGGFIFGNRDLGLQDDLRDKFIENNFAVVSADYRLAPETKLDEILNDVRDVVLWLRQNGAQQFNVDSDKIAVAGGSAGGYLALSTGFTVKPAPQAIIAISGPTEFVDAEIKIGDSAILRQPGPYDIVTDIIVSYGDYEARKELWRFLAQNNLLILEVFGFDVNQDKARLENFMLSKQIDLNYPPTLFVHAINDHLVPVEQARLLYDFLKGKKMQSEIYLVDEGHSSGLIRNNPEAVEKIVAFLKNIFEK